MQRYFDRGKNLVPSPSGYLAEVDPPAEEKQVLPLTAEGLFPSTKDWGKDIVRIRWDRYGLGVPYSCDCPGSHRHDHDEVFPWLYPSPADTGHVRDVRTESDCPHLCGETDRPQSVLCDLGRGGDRLGERSGHPLVPGAAQHV